MVILLWTFTIISIYNCNLLHVAQAIDLSCAQFSSKDSDDYWTSVGRCQSCTDAKECGFCESTLQCLNGTLSGPTVDAQCSSWSFESSSCPLLPNCGDNLDCTGCATQDQCAWCASENLCTTISDAFARECRGLVFEPPCPENYVSGSTKVCLALYN